MGHDPDIIRTLTDCFGPERVLTGTDWPILAALNRDEFRGSLLRAGLNEQEARLVTGSNVRRLLGLQHERRRLSKGRQNIEPRISDPGALCNSAAIGLTAPGRKTRQATRCERASGMISASVAPDLGSRPSRG
ncbi:hypothetical protein Q1M63_07890 (plasmid) [Sinorhizobium meliloti]|nr:hypothetical protein Q1M63_07890 [Sinorhizobium meliloti]